MSTVDSLPFARSKRSKVLDDSDWIWISNLLESYEGQSISNLAVNFIDFKPPEFIIESHKEALDAIGYNQYGPTDVRVIRLDFEAYRSTAMLWVLP